jgi:hypothetical protein
MAELSGGRPFSERLRERRDELRDELLNRVRAVQAPDSAAKDTYVSTLPSTVSAGLDFGLQSIEPDSLDQPPQIPDQLLLQARLAAGSGVSLDTVLRRYCAANAVFTDVLIAEAEDCGLPRPQLKSYFRSLAVGFDHLLSAVSSEYRRAAAELAASAEERRRRLVERLLAGELIEGSELAYDFSAWHVGVVACGLRAQEAVSRLAAEADAGLLAVEGSNEVLWVWLGSNQAKALFSPNTSFPTLPSGVSLAFGEPARGLPGWRLTHRQAAAALPLAVRGSEPVARYAEAPLLVAALGNDLLATSLRELYLAPLATGQDDGATAKRTLRAYFAAAGNASSAAAALGVNRHTVASRLSSIEERLGCRLDAFSAEIETALRLDAL